MIARGVVCADKKDILSMTREEIAAEFAALGLPKYRAGQVYRRLHRFEKGGFEVFSELPLELRERLDRLYEIPSIEIVSKRESGDGTVKYLFKFGDGATAEAVRMDYDHGRTLCISTEVGCPMGCAFCASGIGGLVRRLNASEMLLQVAEAAREGQKRIDGVVMMGTGEPLDNFEASVEFIGLVGEKNGLCIGARHISLSTSGLCERISKLQEYGLGITLSVSLHAADNETRNRLMPVNKRCGVRRLVKTATEYQKATGRRVSYEYALIAGVNDRPEDAQRLIALLKGTGSHINLIRLNRVEERPFVPPPENHVRRFADALARGGLNVTLRRRLGADIEGACGQLRRKELKELKETKGNS